MTIIKGVRNWTTRIKHAVWAFLFLLSYTVSMVAPFVPSAHAAQVTPATNPSLTQACGLDIALVIDNSLSIDSGEMNQMKTALTSFVDALSGTPTEFSVTRFSTSAQVVQGFSGNATTVKAAINGVSTSSGYTNWEDALIKANSTLPNRTNPNLVIFATDGDPTTSNTVGGLDTDQPNAHLSPAISAANTIKTGGTRILALGIGLSGSSIDRLKSVSGPNANTGSVLTSDVISSNFSTLAADLAAFASQTCGGTITTQKLIDADGNLQTTNDQSPASGWMFDVNGGSNPDATSTDSNGLTPAVKVTTGGGYSVSETVKAGYSVLSASCSGATSNGSWASGGTVTGIQVSANNIIRCTFINKADKGSVKLIKEVTNNNGGQLGIDAFGLSIGGTAVTSGQVLTLPAGVPVAINEVGAPGYSFVSITGTGCPATLGGMVTPVKDQTITCTIKNDDNPGTLIVNKILKNDNGGMKKVADFSYKINGGNANAFEVDGSNSHTLNAGTYSVVELADAGYATTYENCTGITLANGATATCTITNDDKPATITLNKTVVNKYGGTKTPADFTPSLTGQQGVSWGVPVSVNAGTYTASEANLAGYTSQGWTGDCAPNGAVSVGNGESKTCSITNTDLPASLSGKKIVANVDLTWVAAGANPASGWTVYLDQNNNGQLDAGETSTVTGADGDYSFTGLNATTQYYIKEVIPTLSGWEQITGVANPVVIGTVGGSSTGNNLMNKAYGHITVVKQLVPSNNPGKFNLLIDNMQKASNVTNGGTTGSVKVEAGTHSVAESAGTSTSLSDYTSAWLCSNGQANTQNTGTTASVVVKPGENWTCTFTNTVKNGTVKVVKTVINDNGGTKTAAKDFTFTNNSGSVQTFIATTGDDGERSLSLPVGSNFNIVEVQANQGNYTTSYSGCTGVVTSGTSTCTITNNDKAPKLTLVKEVQNDNGGTRLKAEWTLSATGPTSISGFGGVVSGGSFKAGTYTLGETGPNDYTKGEWNCGYTQVRSGHIDIKIGDNITCTIVNNDKAPKLTLVKKVINNNGGTKKASDWRLSAAGPSSFSGYGTVSSNSNLKAGTYTLGESGPSGYTASSWDCGYTFVKDSKVTLKLGDDVTCTITNDDKPASLSGYKKLANTDLSWVSQGMNPVSGWIIYLDQNGNGKLDQFEQRTTTNASGYYEFKDLDAGVWYKVAEVIPVNSGWSQIFAPYPVKLDLGENATGKDFKNLAQGTITVIKNVDDGFGHVSKDVSNWTWNYDGKQQDKHHISTGSNNTQTVPSGTYKVSEDQKPGYHVVASRCSSSSNPYDHHQYSAMHEKDGWDHDWNRADEELTVKVGLGEHVTCVFTNERDTGKITVHKKIGDKVNPKGWTWWLEDNGKHIDMGDTEKVETGWYWFGENQQDGYSFESLVCKVDGHYIKVYQGIKSKVYIGQDDRVECTFTNSRDTGTVTVIKDAQPDSTQGFVFMIQPATGGSEDDDECDNILAGDQRQENAQNMIVRSSYDHHDGWHHDDGTSSNPTTSFTLTDNGTDDGKNMQSTILPTGKYMISENSVDGWDLSDVTCGESKVEREDGVVYVNVTKGMHISCTFTNTKRAQLTIVKDATTNGSRSFAFTSTLPDGVNENAAFSLVDDGTGTLNSKQFGNLLPGTYTVTETATTSWKLDNISCTGTGVTMTRNGYVLSVTLAAGAVASCTFVNAFIPQVLAETTLVNTGTETLIAATIAVLLTASAVVVLTQRRKAFVTVRKD